MAGLVYFDTDVFHLVGNAFANQPLSGELRERIVVSPITVLEALSQLTLKKNNEILSQIQAMHNWVNPKKARLLPWPNEAIRTWGFQKTTPADGFIERIERAINTCLCAKSAEQLRKSAARVKDALDRVKNSAEHNFRRLVESNRKEPLVGEKFSKVWVQGIAQRVSADPKSRPIEGIVSALSAYHEFEKERLKLATSNAEYKPDKNDLLDSEQLVYLGNPALNFLTCDGGYSKRVKQSKQAKRIHRVSREALAV